MREVSCYGANAAIANLGTAFANYFRDLKKKTSKTAARPTFKKRGRRESFAVHNNDLKIIDSKTIRLPKVGEVKLKEAIKIKGKIAKADSFKLQRKWCFERLQKSTRI